MGRRSSQRTDDRSVVEVRDSRRKRLQLGETVGGGGEATVYRVLDYPESLAKIYEPAPRDGQERKLAWMQTNPPDDPTLAQGHTSIAWPLDLLYDRRNHFIGYLMRFIRNAVSLLEVFNPRLRAQTLPTFDARYLHRTARNLAVALDALHARGYVVGDLNESNVMVTPTAMVTLIDTDSFQVRVRHFGRTVTYPCPVGKPEYTPPELQGRPLSDTRQYPEHDCFGLAVLIFQLLMEGSHPFRAQWMGSGDPPPIEEKIRQGAFPYMPSPPLPVAPPRNLPGLDILYPPVADLVRRAFIAGHRDPGQRPTPVEWERAVSAAEKALVRCPRGHCFSAHLAACPQCTGTVTVSAKPVTLPGISRAPARAGTARSLVSAPARLLNRWWRYGVSPSLYRVRRGAAGVLRGALIGSVVWMVPGAVLGAIGGGVAGTLRLALLWTSVWVLLWASGWWAFGEILGETIRGPGLGRVLGAATGLAGIVFGAGVGWGMAIQGFERFAGWGVVRWTLNLMAPGVALAGSGGLGSRTLTDMVVAALVWGAIWGAAGAIGGAVARHGIGGRTLIAGLVRVPRKVFGVLWTLRGAGEGALAGVTVSGIVGAVVGGIVGLIGGTISDVPVRAIWGGLLGVPIGALSGGLGAQYIGRIGAKLSKMLAFIEAMVGLSVGVVMASGGLAVLMIDVSLGLTGAGQAALAGLVNGALLGLVSGALVGAISGAIIRAGEV
jgi:hypothetical protein